MKFLNKQSRALFGLSFGHFNVDLYASLIVPLYPYITSKLGINIANISLIIALGHMVSSMLQPVFGFVADKLRHRVFMVWGLVLSSIFIPMTIKAFNIYVFALFLLLGMVGNAVFHPQVSKLIKQFTKNNPDLTRSMSIFLGLGTLGYAIGPYVSTFFVQNFGQDSLLFTSLLGITCAIFIYFFVPKISNNEEVAKENFFIVIKDIIKNKTCMYLTFLSIIKSAVSISFGTYIPFLLKDAGFNLNQTGLIVTIYFVAGALATMTSAKFEKYITTKGVIFLSFVMILPLVFLFLSLIESQKILAIVAFILSGFFIMLSVGVILVQAQKTSSHTGVVSGVIQGFSWGIGALFLAPMGVIAQKYGIDKILILMGAIAFLVSLNVVFGNKIKNN